MVPSPRGTVVRLWARRVWTVLVGIWAGGLIGRAIFDWLLDLQGTALLVGVQGAGMVGAVVGVFVAGDTQASDLPALRPHRVRDTVVGAGAVLALPAAVIVGAVVGLPWGPLAGIGVLVAVLGGLFALATSRRTRPVWPSPLDHTNAGKPER